MGSWTPSCRTSGAFGRSRTREARTPASRYGIARLENALEQIDKRFNSIEIRLIVIFSILTLISFAPITLVMKR